MIIGIEKISGYTTFNNEYLYKFVLYDKTTNNLYKSSFDIISSQLINSYGKHYITPYGKKDINNNFIFIKNINKKIYTDGQQLSLNYIDQYSYWIYIDPDIINKVVALIPEELL